MRRERHSPDVCQGPHNPKVAGSNPAPATIETRRSEAPSARSGPFLLLLLMLVFGPRGDKRVPRAVWRAGRTRVDAGETPAALGCSSGSRHDGRLATGVARRRYLAESMAEDVVASVIDPDGRAVKLTVERWEHIVTGHPEVATFQDQVMETVAMPSRRRFGPTGEEWFYGENRGPSRWLKVVVRYDSIDRGRIMTAFARRSMP
jgi:hypothetical protein